jgi:hypothetical protein
MAQYKVDILNGEVTQTHSDPAVINLDSNDNQSVRFERQKFSRQLTTARNRARAQRKVDGEHVPSLQEGFHYVHWSNLPTAMWFTDSVSAFKFNKINK